jgi:hypothetical protein
MIFEIEWCIVHKAQVRKYDTCEAYYEHSDDEMCDIKIAKVIV